MLLAIPDQTTVDDGSFPDHTSCVSTSITLLLQDCPFPFPFIEILPSLQDPVYMKPIPSPTILSFCFLYMLCLLIILIPAMCWSHFSHVQIPPLEAVIS